MIVVTSMRHRATQQNRNPRPHTPDPQLIIEWTAHPSAGAAVPSSQTSAAISANANSPGAPSGARVPRPYGPVPSPSALPPSHADGRTAGSSGRTRSLCRFVQRTSLIQFGDLPQRTVRPAHDSASPSLDAPSAREDPCICKEDGGTLAPGSGATPGQPTNRLPGPDV